MITELGHLYTMGCNKYGQLGVPHQIPQVGSPALVEALKTQNVLNVSCGKDFTLVVASNCGVPRVWAFGGNKHGQLGLPYKQAYFLPTIVEPFEGLD